MMPRSSSRSFLFLAANTPWVYALARSLEAHGAVTAMRFYDWANYRRLAPQWPAGETAMRRVMVRMPPGYAGKLEPFFRPIMRALIDRERSRLRKRSGAEPIVVCPYPYLVPWIRRLPGRLLVYYNLDDYVLYDVARSARTIALEDELVRKACLTLCLSQRQVETLRKRNPAAAARIRHFPLGVGEEFLIPDSGSRPLERTVGYVGNLTDRVDWAFVARVAELVPDARFHFVGDAKDAQVGRGLAATDAWQSLRARVLAMANVIHEGPVPQAAVPEHYWRYSINWMPYDTRHPFNVASCPTKIMDALASGRPFVSTDVPEVRLYPERLHLVATPEEAASRLRELLDRSDHDARSQVEFAASQTWPHRARRFIELLEESVEHATVAIASGNEPIRTG